MASSSGPALNEELLCSICLEVFTDPVTTPCGHNFCRTCLSNCWTNTQTCFCPLCTETFSKRPDLKINTTLREVVQLFNLGESRSKLNLGESEVVCDICGERKQKAVKTCLMCQSSFCETHLEAHHRVPRLKKHTLINPVENLEDYICQKHERPLEMFCRDDQMCVCLFCTEGEHKTHNTVPVEEESREKKKQLVQTQTDVHQMIQDRMKKIQDIQYSVEQRKSNMEKEKCSSVEIFTDLIHSIERCQSELLKMMEEQQKETEKQAEDLIKELQQEITELEKRNTELEKLSHTDDHLHVIQMNSSLDSLPHTKNWTEIRIDSDVNVIPLYRVLTPMKKTQVILNKKLSQTGLKFMQKYAVDLTLDPDTAYPFLILSDDGKQVSDGDIEQDVPENPKRFDKACSVLAKQGFSSGRFYYEVQVKGKTQWRLGVIRESINRKGTITMTPVDGVWILIMINEDAYAVSDDLVVIFPPSVKPEKVGVFVDYQEGLVSFYDVDSRSHIYSFTGQTFTEKLYPYFSPCDNDEGKNSRPLIITPVS